MWPRDVIAQRSSHAGKSIIGVQLEHPAFLSEVRSDLRYRVLLGCASGISGSTFVPMITEYCILCAVCSDSKEFHRKPKTNCNPNSFSKKIRENYCLLRETGGYGGVGVVGFMNIFM